mmetsp:Transcript_45110/g.127348  ORF Transcript_45110/g.127348 Transcript_45110/m.127348 type:complete len:348 (+) Transcript_45110:292-1335(+)
MTILHVHPFPGLSLTDTHPIGLISGKQLRQPPTHVKLLWRRLHQLRLDRKGEAHAHREVPVDVAVEEPHAGVVELHPHHHPPLDVLRLALDHTGGQQGGGVPLDGVDGVEVRLVFGCVVGAIAVAEHPEVVTVAVPWVLLRDAVNRVGVVYGEIDDFPQLDVHNVAHPAILLRQRIRLRQPQQRCVRQFQHVPVDLPHHVVVLLPVRAVDIDQSVGGGRRLRVVGKTNHFVSVVHRPPLVDVLVDLRQHALDHKPLRQVGAVGRRPVARRWVLDRCALVAHNEVAPEVGISVADLQPAPVAADGLVSLEQHRIPCGNVDFESVDCFGLCVVSLGLHNGEGVIVDAHR